MDIAGLKRADRNVEGIAELMLNATRNYRQPLSEEPLFAWHAIVVSHRARRHSEDQS